MKSQRISCLGFVVFEILDKVLRICRGIKEASRSEELRDGWSMVSGFLS